MFDPALRRALKVVGARRVGAQDLYYSLLAAGWWQLTAVAAGAYLVLNALFGLAFFLTGGVENARPGSFGDAFFFSVQTLATIGYGHMYPRGVGAEVLVTLESLVGIAFAAVITGIVFAKFARPRARIMFSRNVVIAMRDGVPALMLRVANERRNHVVEAQARLALMRNEVTKEGEPIRKVLDLPLVRSQQPSFILTWTVIHPITPDSPLYGATPEDLERWDAQIITSVVGLDETLNQTIHARYAWLHGEVLYDKRFADVIRPLTDGSRALDYGRFHEIEELPPHVTRIS